MLKNKELTYISLFSSAGVGCYGFKMEGYHCIATNEIIERRLMGSVNVFAAGDTNVIDVQVEEYNKFENYEWAPI